jgi:tRNA (adenine22-N1)-methyltransferase
MKLTNRLQTIAEMVNKDAIVGDIGSDHGYLVTYLVEEKLIKRGIASDINEGPVLNCKKTVKEYGFENVIDVRLGGGFDPYTQGEIDTAIIAGMGGELIRDIIIAGCEIVDTTDLMLLQPMTGQDVLRAYLINNDYEILEERIAVEQNRFYEIIKVQKGQHILAEKIHLKHIAKDDPLLMEIGLEMIVDEAYVGFINKKISKYEQIKSQLSHLEAHPKLDLANHNLSLLREVLTCIQM